MLFRINLSCSILLQLLLFCRAFTWAETALHDEPPRRYLRSANPIVLNDSTCSEIVRFRNMTWPSECFLACQLRNCASLTVANRNFSRCELVFINDCSQAPGPVGSHAARLIGSDVDAAVETWIAENFFNLVETRRQVNGTNLFFNSSTGRNGSIQQLLINVTGCYRIEAFGAAGGSNDFMGVVGGKGAFAAGTFVLTGGTELNIVVGQAGGPASIQNTGGGGGGGSFVYQNRSRLYIAAGGGGGASSKNSGVPGQGGPNGTNSSANEPLNAGIGGADGEPGFVDPSESRANFIGGCGAGWLGPPVYPRSRDADGDRGGSYDEGWLGGAAGVGNTGDGGFGGGGGAGSDGGNPIRKASAGAAGGFSGGGAGIGHAHAGGGGGSVCGKGSYDCVLTAGGNVENTQGRVIVRLLKPGVNCG